MMKKIMNYAILSAIAFTGAIGFSSCSDENVVAENNPNYNPATDEVNVDFVFNVSTANEPTTRMSAATTQANLSQPFRGITDAYLGAFKLSDDGEYVTDPDGAADKLHSLGPVLGAGKLNPNAEASGDVTKSRRVLQLSLASGTNSLMFWGKAPKNGTDLEEGKITMNIAETPSATTITMNKIVPETAETSGGYDQATLAQYQYLMAAVMTYIINSGIKATEVTFGSQTQTVTLNWKDYAVVTGDAGSYKLSEPTKDPAETTEDLSLLGQRLAFAFVTLNTIHANELRAGCGQAVSDMISDLMANINQVATATPLNFREAVAKAIAADIVTRVETFFDKGNDYAWKATSDVKTAASFVRDVEKDKVRNADDLNEFPANFNLPSGAVILELAIEAEATPATGYKYTYNYAGTVDTYAMGGGTNAAFDPKNYMYPAELCYFGNSPIRVTNETLAPGDYPDGVVNWETESSWASKNWEAGKHVTTSTRSVAMKDNINYGTALLETKVRYGAQVLQDNNHNLQWEWSGHVTDEPNNTVDVSERDDAFVLTGVLVGGQNPEVGWNYIAKTSETGFGSMVYDKTNTVITKASAESGGNASQPVYTLLWDNWDQSLKGSKQRDVYVALEFKNNSKNFFGENNLIRNGATFYIVGKLDPNQIPSGLTGVTQEDYNADKSLGIMWPTKYALPPYDTDGKGIKERRVFIQDYLTSVCFVINETSLQHALVAVPDLRSGQISLGLSVDLSWRTGINFGEVILGQ